MRPAALLLFLVGALWPAAATAVPAEPLAVFRECAACPPMVVLPPGAIAMGRTEVTFRQYRACVAAGGCRAMPDDHGWGRGERPVINVTYADAERYAAWLAATTGAPYRLPRDGESTRAARAGTDTAYWWGDAMRGGHANCRHCGVPEGGRKTAPVASYPANPWGLHDMNGNVWEWVAACWRDGAGGTEDCRRRGIRGGSWYYVPGASRSDSRAPMLVADWSYGVGIRVVREMPTD